MEFFNQKEEVIDIQLTQYGKRILADGHFKPVYYSFFDKDILYNSEFGGFDEHQNNTETRIKNEKPRLKVQHNFIGVETQFNEMKQIILSGGGDEDEEVELLQDTENKYFSIDSKIGTTRLENRFNPSWKIQFYNNNLQKAEVFTTGSGQPQRIPQLDATITYHSYAVQNPEEINDGYDETTKLEPSIENSDEVLDFEDGSQIFVKDDFILLGIEEKNTNFFNENFEIEILMEEENTITNTKKLTPLRFLSDDVLFDED